MYPSVIRSVPFGPFATLVVAKSFKRRPETEETGVVWGILLGWFGSIPSNSVHSDGCYFIPSCTVLQDQSNGPVGLSTVSMEVSTDFLRSSRQLSSRDSSLSLIP